MSAISLQSYSFPIGNQQNIHLLNGGSPATTKSVVDKQAYGILSAAYADYMCSGEARPAPMWKENVLHKMGDARSHVNRDTGQYYHAGLGHAAHSKTPGKDPDDPYTNPEAHIEYGMRLYEMGSAISGSAVAGREEAQNILRGLTKVQGTERQRGYVRDVLGRYGVKLPEPAPGHGLLGTGE